MPVLYNTLAKVDTQVSIFPMETMYLLLINIRLGSTDYQPKNTQFVNFKHDTWHCNYYNTSDTIKKGILKSSKEISDDRKELANIKNPVLPSCRHRSWIGSWSRLPSRTPARPTTAHPGPSLLARPGLQPGWQTKLYLGWHQPNLWSPNSKGIDNLQVNCAEYPARPKDPNKNSGSFHLLLTGNLLFARRGFAVRSEGICNPRLIFHPLSIDPLSWGQDSVPAVITLQSARRGFTIPVFWSTHFPLTWILESGIPILPSAKSPQEKSAMISTILRSDTACFLLQPLPFFLG